MHLLNRFSGLQNDNWTTNHVWKKKADILKIMKKNEQFPWPIEQGTAVDFADSTLILAVKDDEWNDAQLASAAAPFTATVCERTGLVIFLLEGGPLDTCDFYFNIQECDDKDELLAKENLDVQAVLIDGSNMIKAIKTATLSRENTQALCEMLERQNRIEFMPGEYEVNVEGMQSAFEPPELAKFQKLSFTLN